MPERLRQGRVGGQGGERARRFRCAHHLIRPEHAAEDHFIEVKRRRGLTEETPRLPRQRRHACRERQVVDGAHRLGGDGLVVIAQELGHQRATRLFRRARQALRRTGRPCSPAGTQQGRGSNAGQRHHAAVAEKCVVDALRFDHGQHARHGLGIARPADCQHGHHPHPRRVVRQQFAQPRHRLADAQIASARAA